MNTTIRTNYGNWTYDPERICLVFGNDQYEVDFERMETSAACLDWIFQVAQWADAKDMHDLLLAIRDHIDPQANLCSWGVENKRRK